MTFEKKCFVDPADVIAVHYECGKCHPAVVVPVEKLKGCRARIPSRPRGDEQHDRKCRDGSLSRDRSGLRSVGARIRQVKWEHNRRNKMKRRFVTLTVLCHLQLLLGFALVIAGAIGIAEASSVIPILSHNVGMAIPGFLIAIFGIAVIFVGLQLVAIAEVYQCLLQIEINTRR
jgi:hypothetical protein